MGNTKKRLQLYWTFKIINSFTYGISRSGDQSRPGTLEHVFAIEEDGEGNIWFRDRDTGVWKYDGNTIKNYTNNLGQSNDFVHSIYKDKNDELWFVLTNGNVFKFNGKTFNKQF